ncbi:hypothetical protein TNCT_383111 [Trichonephila clavata]|uniref:Uncharacterized protein n=1 Tax=Trichonephila clavata TaxID=2740835 RepID=A0A8X6GL57_TRICU|nr:hypothetical protein TNCT_383111 [Trichonephila clavata]
MEVYGPDVMTKQMVRRWYRQLSDGYQQVQDIPIHGWPHMATADEILGRWMTFLKRTVASPSMEWRNRT